LLGVFWGVLGPVGFSNLRFHDVIFGSAGYGLLRLVLEPKLWLGRPLA
jgi:hypothetical protein